MIQNETKMQPESLEELMAQFRELETASKSPSESYPGPTSPKYPQKPSFCMATTTTSRCFPDFSWKNRTSWYPYLLVLGGLFVFVTVLTAIFRPSFLYSSEEAFLWKRFFLTILFTYLLLLGALYGLYYYAVRL